jgi:hypothetical protein
MLKIKAWVIIQLIGTTKEPKDRKIVFSSRHFNDIIKFLESKENYFDDNYWRNRRIRRGVVGHRNDDWIAYVFYPVRIMM